MGHCNHPFLLIFSFQKLDSPSNKGKTRKIKKSPKKPKTVMVDVGLFLLPSSRKLMLLKSDSDESDDIPIAASRPKKRARISPSEAVSKYPALLRIY